MIKIDFILPSPGISPRPRHDTVLAELIDGKSESKMRVRVDVVTDVSSLAENS